jgi:hypothetical protein
MLIVGDYHNYHKPKAPPAHLSNDGGAFPFSQHAKLLADSITPCRFQLFFSFRRSSISHDQAMPPVLKT